MPFVQVDDDARIYYDVRGDGPPLVLIHGAWASHEWWRWQIPALSREYRVFSLDVRGHGRSSALERAYSVEGFARDLEIFLQNVGVDECALIGWSMGGIISMQFCLDHPSLVKALILIATRGHWNPAMKPRILLQYFRSVLDLLMDFTRPRRYDRTGQSFALEKEKWIEKEAKKMLSPTAPREVVDWVMTDLMQNPRKNYLTIARSLWNWEAGDALKEINSPTLIMVGEDDLWTPPKFSHLMSSEIPNSRLMIVENTGHYLALERPELINAEMITFLKSLDY